MWPGVEPRLGEIDTKYLEEMARLSTELSRRGVYTVVDLHQDIGSRRFCGEGFPEHYVDALAQDPESAFARSAAFPKPLPYPAPNATVPALDYCLRHNFGFYYLAAQVGAMWSELYRANSSMHEGFVGYWRAVSQHFTARPHVLGYELINEPNGVCLGGGLASCLDLPIGSSVEAKKLTPLYQAAAAAIREVDATTPIFFEPVVLPKVTDKIFPVLPLGNDTQQVFAYHVYCQPGDGEGPGPAALCRASQDLFTHGYFGFLRRHPGVAGFMTEFGAVGGSPEELKHLQRLLGLADGQFQSWAYWMLKKYGDFTTADAAESLYEADGTLNVPKLKTLSRTYAPAIAGTPKKMAFDPDTGKFTLAFIATVTDAPTVIYMNEALHYPDGFSLQTSPARCLTARSSETNYLELFLAPGPSCVGATVTVSIERKDDETLFV